MRGYLTVGIVLCRWAPQGFLVVENRRDTLRLRTARMLWRRAAGQLVLLSRAPGLKKKQTGIHVLPTADLGLQKPSNVRGERSKNAVGSRQCLEHLSNLGVRKNLPKLEPEHTLPEFTPKPFFPYINGTTISLAQKLAVLQIHPRSEPFNAYKACRGVAPPCRCGVVKFGNVHVLLSLTHPSVMPNQQSLCSLPQRIPAVANLIISSRCSTRNYLCSAQ